MGDLQIQHSFALPPPPLPPLPSSSRDDHGPPASRDDPPPPPPPPFDPSRMIGIIRRKALVKELAAAYHAECLTYCQELLELQKKIEEVFRLHRKDDTWPRDYIQVSNQKSQELYEKALRYPVTKPFTDIKVPEEPRKEMQRPSKRPKKYR